MYLWVAELQKRGEIHFHILTPSCVDKNLINSCWSSIVSKWYKKEGKKFDKVLPNVKATYNAGAYMSKYLSKDGEGIHGNLYGLSQNAHELLKPIIEDNIPTTEKNAISIIHSTLDQVDSESYYKVQNKNDKTVAIWFYDGRDFLNKLYFQKQEHE